VSDKYQLVGSWGTTPQTGSLLASGATALQTPVNESVTLSQKNFDDYDLVVDTPVAVAFGGVASANVVNVFCNRPITVRLTRASASQQSIAVDGWLMLGSKTDPYTAIDLTRVPGQETLVKVFLGQKS
jgi:ribosomal protein L10